VLAPCYEKEVSAWVASAVVVALVAACGTRERTLERSPVERAIDEALGARFGAAVVTRCFEYAPVCEARLPDGSALPISVVRRGPAWEWRVIGLVVTSDELEAYLRDELADLGAPQGVSCAPRIRRIAAGDRIECGLAGGGKGFVTVRADGSISVEVVLEEAAAKARSERHTPARELELFRASAALDRAGETGEDEAAPPDAGELGVSPGPR